MSDRALEEPAKRMSETEQKVFTLHRYFIWADQMRVHFERILAAGSPMAQGMMDVETFLYMSYWYAATYVVVEGWRELGLEDRNIDTLLASPNVDLLRRYRNAVFHFQPKYFDNRFDGFIGAEGTPQWVRELRKEFSRYFLQQLDATKGERQ